MLDFGNLCQHVLDHMELNNPKKMKVENVKCDAMTMALDLVEVNPLLFENPSDVKKTVFSAVRVILSFFGFNTIGTIDSDCVVQKPYGRIANKPNEDEKM